MCYSIPLVSAVITTSVYLKNRNPKMWWLNLMLYGAALFGVIDHWWNGQLFLISNNIYKDLLLGVVITVSIFVAWVIIINHEKKRFVFNNKT